MLVFSIILLILATVGFYLDDKFWYSSFWLPVAMISTILVIIVSLLWGMNYFIHSENIRTYHSTKATVEEMRKQEISDVERATISQSIISINSWLYNAQYWNETIVGDFIPDEVMELTPLK